MRDHSHWDDTDLQAGKDWIRGLKRFHGKPEWSNSDDDCFLTDDKEDKREDESDDSGHGLWLPNSDTPSDDDNGSDDDDPSVAEKSSDSDKDRRPPTKKRKRN